MAIWTMQHGKNDAKNPFSKQNYHPGAFQQEVYSMPHITLTLTVTAAAMRHVASGHPHERQIAIQGASDGLLATIHGASRDHRITVPVSGVFELQVGDTSAIWERHQTAGVQAADFASLYDLLARRPDRPVTFTWDE